MDVEALLPPGIPDVDERLACARVPCRRQRCVVAGSACLECDHYRGWRDGPGLTHVTVACAFAGACDACGTTDDVHAGLHSGVALCAACLDLDDEDERNLGEGD